MPQLELITVASEEKVALSDQPPKPRQPGQTLKSGGQAEYLRNWKKANPEKVKQYGKTYRQNMTEEQIKKLRSAGKRWRLNNPERAKQMVIDHAARDESKTRAKHRKLKNRYGLTPEQYQSMLKEQDGKCAICQCKPNYHLHVDHCHETNRVRGLLCHNCNHMLGAARDDTTRLAAGINYLEKFYA